MKYLKSKLFYFKEHYSDIASQFVDSILQITEPLPIITAHLYKVLFLYPVIKLTCCQLT